LFNVIVEEHLEMAMKELLKMMSESTKEQKLNITKAMKEIDKSSKL